MFRLLLITLCLFLLPLQALNLCEQFTQAKVGSYVVYSSQKEYTLLKINGIEGSWITFEEASIQKKQADWKQWIDKGCPGALSHLLFTIDLEHNQVLEAFSKLKNEFLTTDGIEATFIKLLQLEWNTVPDHKRKKIGRAPKEDEQDHRKLWNPPILQNGEPLRSLQTVQWESLWPEDQSELSNHTLNMFLTKSSVTPFPVWIELHLSAGMMRLRLADCGITPQASRVFLRAPTIIKVLKDRSDNKLLIYADCPKYFQTLLLKQQTKSLPLHLEKTIPGDTKCVYSLEPSLTTLISEEKGPIQLVPKKLSQYASSLYRLESIK